MENLTNVENISYLLWALAAILLGAFGSILTNRFVNLNIRTFQWMHKRSGLSFFKKQAEQMARPYMYTFSRILGAVFIIIGIITIVSILAV